MAWRPLWPGRRRPASRRRIRQAAWIRIGQCRRWSNDRARLGAVPDDEMHVGLEPVSLGVTFVGYWCERVRVGVAEQVDLVELRRRPAGVELSATHSLDERLGDQAVDAESGGFDAATQIPAEAPVDERVVPVVLRLLRRRGD